MNRLNSLILAIALAANMPAFAADHLDGPAVSGDPAADINDLYAFVNPNDPGELVFAATVMPLADENARFSNAVEYRFHIHHASGVNGALDIACRFPGKAVVCRGPQDTEVSGPQERVNQEGGLRVFAGLRDDPFFFDLGAFLDTVDALAPQFTDPGTDFFEGLNTLAIVVGVDIALLGADTGDSILQVYASTNRSESPGLGRISRQVDRMGRPGINTALIDLLASTGKKDQYNQAADPALWPSLFESEIASNLAALDTLDGVPGNALLPPLVLASVLVDDRLLIDAAEPYCDAYLAVELGLPQCGGRTLARDVIDDTLGAVVGPGVSDFVGNTSVFLDDFPFLGTPN